MKGQRVGHRYMRLPRDAVPEEAKRSFRHIRCRGMILYFTRPGVEHRKATTLDRVDDSSKQKDIGIMGNSAKSKEPRGEVWPSEKLTKLKQR